MFYFVYTKDFTFNTHCSLESIFTAFQTSPIYVMTLFFSKTMPTCPRALIAKHTLIAFYKENYVYMQEMYYISRRTCGKFTRKCLIPLFTSLLASHIFPFHPGWHPPSQWPVTLSHTPVFLQLGLQNPWQFSPYNPGEHSVRI